MPSVYAYAEDRDAEALRHFQAGQRAQQDGSYEIAAQEYLKVIAIMPQAAEAYASLGLAYNAEYKFSESAIALTKAERLKPGLAGVNLYLGIDHLKLRQPEKAIRNLQTAIQEEPANKQAWLWLSAALSENGQAGKVIENLDAANRLFPSDPEILFRLGDEYRLVAEEETQKAITDSTGQPLVHQIYGDIYMEEGQWMKAITHYRRALAENGQWRGAHLGIGEAALRQGKFEEAEQELDQELEINPRSALADGALAEVELLQGRAGTALKFLDDAIRVAPHEASYALGLPISATVVNSAAGTQDLDGIRKCIPALFGAHPGPSQSLAMAFIDAHLGNRTAYISAWNEYEKAERSTAFANLYQRATTDFYRNHLNDASAELRSWLNTNPDDSPAHYLLGRCYRGLSLSVLDQLFTAAPNSYPTHMLLGETYENAEEDEKAIAEYRLAEEMAPDLPGIHFALGHLLRKHGNSDEAMAEYNQELRVDPDHPVANAELGEILIHKGEPEKGVAYLTKAVKLQPDLWAAHRALGKVYYQQRKLPMAEAELHKAVDHDPEGMASYQLGLVYRALGRTQDAKAMFSRSQQIKEDRLADVNASRSAREDSQP